MLYVENQRALALFTPSLLESVRDSQDPKAFKLRMYYVRVLTSICLLEAADKEANSLIALFKSSPIEYQDSVW